MEVDWERALRTFTSGVVNSDSHYWGFELVLSTKPRALSLTGVDLARKDWKGGPVSPAAAQSHQHPSHFCLLLGERGCLVISLEQFP